MELALGFYVTWLLPLALLRQTKSPSTTCNIGRTPERMACACHGMEES